MDFMYNLLVWFFSLVLKTFFSDVEVVGLENVPKDGAVIFTGNHQNQFVVSLSPRLSFLLLLLSLLSSQPPFLMNFPPFKKDGLMLLTTCGRDISFLIAEKSFHRMVVGFFAKLVHAIPVKRRQDVAKPVSSSIMFSFFPFLADTLECRAKAPSLHQEKW
jgi:glycerol-3-phosphate O-acyltransferase/dihydroxyacetone phosphate acyltransferase